MTNSSTRIRPQGCLDRIAGGYSPLLPGAEWRESDHHDIDPEHSIWEACGFGEVPLNNRRELLATGQRVLLERGEFVSQHRDAEGPWRRIGATGLVLHGLVRLYARSGERQVTLQYCGHSELFGVPSMAAGETLLETTARAIHPTSLIVFSPATLDLLASRDLATANAVITLMRQAHAASLELLSENVLWSLRQRVARHLLDLTSADDPKWHVPVTVQDLADATGTVREVVTRLLRDMRHQGLLARHNGELVITDVLGLHRVALGD